MTSTNQSDSNPVTNEYEDFGLYPYRVLQDIVTRLEVGGYKDSRGHSLVESSEFLELEKMAFEPAVPDPATSTIAAIISYLEGAGYEDRNGRTLNEDPFILPLKQMNVRKLFRSQSEDGLRLLHHLGAASYRINTEAETRKLEDDQAFQNLHAIITLEGREGKV